jgi:hypothetical protein
MFLSRGVQFKVVSCQPLSGVITAETEIYTTGAPLTDVAKIEILPILESLPNSEQQFTGPQFFSKYLTPYFQGRFVYVERNMHIHIDGIEFIVCACEPVAGIVTPDTEIFNAGDPIRSEDLRRQQLDDDERMARAMSEQENHVARGGRRAAQPAGQTPEEVRGHLAELMRRMPPNDPHRAMVQRLYDQLGRLPAGAQLMGADRGMMSLLQRAVSGAPIEVNRGASQNDIDNLPTRIYHAPPEAPVGSKAKTQAEAEKDRVTCMVCLSEYEEADELRTLPCFHSYHKACIDEWLARNKTCAVCKNPICP